jgi:hypothetical protein
MEQVQMLFRRLLSLLLILTGLVAGPVHAACTNPAGNTADIVYNSAYHTYQFCNGTGWLQFGGGSNCTPASGYSEASSSGSGYFVVTSTTWNGNLGGFGLLGADALCLTELSSTHTGWKGYSTANSNGQLVATKVHAFLCDQQTCTNLMPLTTYFFANAASGTAGGASFTTDANGNGPQDNANWSGATYFNGTYSYWTNMGPYGASTTLWNSAPQNTSNTFGDCNNWTDSTQPGGVNGNSANTDYNRWATNNPACSNTFHLLCFVNP